MGRIVLYSPEGSSLDAVLALQACAHEVGVAATECAVGRSLGDVLAGLGEADELVVGSLSCFVSLNELLGVVASGGVRVRSLGDPWFSDPIVDPQQYQRRLYELSSQLHARRTQCGLDKAALDGRRPGRRLGSVQTSNLQNDIEVRRVDQLRAEQGLSIEEACRRMGVSIQGYYRKRKKHIGGQTR